MTVVGILRLCSFSLTVKYRAVPLFRGVFTDWKIAISNFGGLSTTKCWLIIFLALQARFQGAAFCSAAVYTQMGEGDLAVALTKVAAAHPKVSIGSYPNTGTPHPVSEYKVKLAFSGRDQAAVDAAVEAVRAAGLQVFDREA